MARGGERSLSLTVPNFTKPAASLSKIFSREILSEITILDIFENSKFNILEIYILYCYVLMKTWPLDEVIKHY